MREKICCYINFIVIISVVIWTHNCYAEDVVFFKFDTLKKHEALVRRIYFDNGIISKAIVNFEHEEQKPQILDSIVNTYGIELEYADNPEPGIMKFQCSYGYLCERGTQIFDKLKKNTNIETKITKLRREAKELEEKLISVDKAINSQHSRLSNSIESIKASELQIAKIKSEISNLNARLLTRQS